MGFKANPCKHKNKAFGLWEYLLFLVIIVEKLYN